MVNGPVAGLELLAGLDDALGRSHRLDAVRGHLYEMAGLLPEAHAAFLAAAKKTQSLQERRYLLGKVAKLDSTGS
jgi:predicted RNA polymerase sigma factor